MTRVELFTTANNAPGHRVAIALRCKGIVFVARDAASPDTPEKPFGLLPFVRIDGRIVGQSLAIIDLLDQLWPSPALLPPSAIDAARVKSAVQYIASEIHAVNAKSVHDYLAERHACTPGERSRWYAHWMCRGLKKLESMAAQLAESGGPRFAGWPFYVAISAYPQLCNARRNGVSLAGFPELAALAAAGDADLRFDWPPAFTESEYNSPDRPGAVR